jgi:hypothetical protein
MERRVRGALSVGDAGVALGREATSMAADGCAAGASERERERGRSEAMAGLIAAAAAVSAAPGGGCGGGRGALPMGSERAAQAAGSRLPARSRRDARPRRAAASERARRLSARGRGASRPPSRSQEECARRARLRLGAVSSRLLYALFRPAAKTWQGRCHRSRSSTLSRRSSAS